MEQSKCSLFVTILLCLYVLESPYLADAHILVYRRLTNQLIEEYNDLPAQFGPELSSTGIRVFGITVTPLHPEEQNDYGCTPINQPPKSFLPSTAKFAAIMQRGGINCTFELKVRNAQNASFDAVIIYNNAGDDLENMSAQNSSGITIPSVFVGRTTGTNLKSFSFQDVVLVVNDELPFNINTQLILPFSILIGVCFLLMIIYMIYKCVREERRSRRHRLPKRLLRRIPIVKITKTTDLGYDVCVICIEKFSEGEKVRVLPCRHPYHAACIDVWLTQNKRDCPICKRKVFIRRRIRLQPNPQSSLDNSTDTDDDTRPLLAQLVGGNGGSTTATASSNTTTTHGTFRRGSGGDNNIEAVAGENVASDDENMLTSPGQRINPFDRTPNLPPHLQQQLNNGATSRSVWSWPVFRWLKRPTQISIAAPPFQDDILNDVVAGLPQSEDSVSISNNNSSQTMQAVARHSSNNVLNPSLSGSFQSAYSNNAEEAASVQCIYEPVDAITNGDEDSMFIQTPTQGGIAVAALPPQESLLDIEH